MYLLVQNVMHMIEQEDKKDLENYSLGLCIHNTAKYTDRNSRRKNFIDSEKLSLSLHLRKEAL